jgi:hypothetical protein
MEAAQGGSCPDFTVPDEMPELEAFHGKHTSGSSYSSSSSSSSSSGYSTTTEQGTGDFTGGQTP